MRIPKCFIIDENIDGDQPIVVECKPLQKSVIFQEIEIFSNNFLPKHLPVIAYKYGSDISCEESYQLCYGVNQYSVKIEVKNNGNRIAFVVFTSGTENNFNISVNPVSSLIYPKSASTFEFLIDSPHLPTEIPIVMYFGDEILREIKAFLDPNNFFAKIFD